MAPQRRLYAKGALHSQQIIDAALRCIARDGYAATSMQRVADEAGLPKRAVIYHYGTRERLFDTVVRHIGDQFLEQLEEAVSGIEEPTEIIARAIERIWAAITTDRSLVAAWFGLVAESITNPQVRETTQYVTERYRGLVRSVIDQAAKRGHVFAMRRESLEVLVLAGLQGLVMDYLEHGETPELRAAIEDLQSWLEA